MDDSSSIGLTDEEFQIKKQRMIQGEIEKTIKSFPQVEDTRVHITFGESSVFEKEAIPGSAAVYLMLKPGTTLEKNQIKICYGTYIRKCYKYTREKCSSH